METWKILLLILGIGIIILLYRNSEKIQLKCVLSENGNNKYCVRKDSLVEESVPLLTEVTNRANNLVTYMSKKYPDNKEVKLLVKNYRPNNIKETLPNSEYTAYSEEKGEKIALCLRESKKSNKLIDINTLTFVMIHELAHVGTESFGHKREFWEFMKFLLENAVSIGIYEPINYEKEAQEYCGMTIDDNPIFDK